MWYVWEKREMFLEGVGGKFKEKRQLARPKVR